MEGAARNVVFSTVCHVQVKVASNSFQSFVALTAVHVNTVVLIYLSTQCMLTISDIIPYCA